MKTTTLMAVAMVGSLALWGCDSGGSSAGAGSASAAVKAKPGSCQEGGPKGDTCSDYSAEGATKGKSYCEKTGGGKNVWSDSKCRAEGRIGTCERKGGQTQHYYKGGMLDADAAKEMCTTMSNGKWKAPAAAGAATGAATGSAAAPAASASAAAK